MIARDFLLSVLAELLAEQSAGELFGNIGRNLASRISGPQPYKPGLSLDGKVAGMDTLLTIINSSVCSLSEPLNASITDLFTHLVRTKVSKSFDGNPGASMVLRWRQSMSGHAGLRNYGGKCRHWF